MGTKPEQSFEHHFSQPGVQKLPEQKQTQSSPESAEQKPVLQVVETSQESTQTNRQDEVMGAVRELWGGFEKQADGAGAAIEFAAHDQNIQELSAKEIMPLVLNAIKTIDTSSPATEAALNKLTQKVQAEDPARFEKMKQFIQRIKNDKAELRGVQDSLRRAA